jgi:hypothetical protein
LAAGDKKLRNAKKSDAVLQTRKDKQQLESVMPAAQRRTEFHLAGMIT